MTIGKLLMEERTKTFLQIHRGNIDIVHRELGYPKDYILKIRTKMPKALRKLPEAEKLWVGENIVLLIQQGSMERKAILNHELEILYNRGQLLVCVHCGTEITSPPGMTELDQAHCGKCDKIVYRTKSDRLEILKGKLNILNLDKQEDELTAKWGALQFALKNPTQQVVPQTQNIYKNSMLVLQGKDKEVSDLYLKSKPQDREKLMQGLLEKITILEAEVLEEEKNEPRTEEGSP